ncbi:MAG TPA: glycoside hydrolase family 130 protein [Chthoniobacterales bacterium]
MINKADGVFLRPNAGRVLLRPFIPDPMHASRIIERALAFSEAEVAKELQAIRMEFNPRHRRLDQAWAQHLERVASYLPKPQALSAERRALIGALFTGEYTLESTALFSPSIVAHPDQDGVAEHELRFILSLRAIGEGHISSIEFRSGTICADRSILFDQATPFVSSPQLNADATSWDRITGSELKKTGHTGDGENCFPSGSDGAFTPHELDGKLPDPARPLEFMPGALQLTVQSGPSSLYEVQFEPSEPLSERVLFPHSETETNGMEDVRFVRFVENDQVVTYYGTYTAYNGRAILPQLIETTDFCRFRIQTLSGPGIYNKGMALFPRRVEGRYAMLSRQDNENIFLMFSDDLHFWSDPEVLIRPEQPWEMVKVGNCGSPLETEAGWLVLTHGVGPLRKYCLGLALLDLQNPRQVLGRLKQPLLEPQENDWQGYVPNVVYSCGGLIHEGRLVLPYGTNDSETRIVTFELDTLLKALLEPAVPV